jgi:hypothetical protein
MEWALGGRASLEQQHGGDGGGAFDAAEDAAAQHGGIPPLVLTILYAVRVIGGRENLLSDCCADGGIFSGCCFDEYT